MTTLISSGPTNTFHTHSEGPRRPAPPSRPYTDPNRLAPEDAFLSQPLSRHSPASSIDRIRGIDSNLTAKSALDLRSLRNTSRRRASHRSTRRPKRTWKKLLWVKQKDYPDNYTDPSTFLSHLQRNPRLRFYDFWPLVADSTVIVQHISSVAIFVCAFVAIYQSRVSSVTVVSGGSAGSILGWILWDLWTIQLPETSIQKPAPLIKESSSPSKDSDSQLTTSTGVNHPSQASRASRRDSHDVGLGLSLSTSSSHLFPKPYPDRRNQNSMSTSASASASSGPSPSLSSRSSQFGAPIPLIAPEIKAPQPRVYRVLSTAKSALLIYISLLGLSPILKSLTESTSSDSIWAMTCWLMCINIFFFDYSGGVGGVKFPASLSTNAAIMASTVLASRLPSTIHVFSLTLFSIEVFGLFPVFRRHLRHVSWQGHLILTGALMAGAGASLGIIVTSRPFLEGGWKRAIAGAFVWSIGSMLGMGGCSWWLINLQRYKNVVIGPWDPARPVIRGGSWAT